MESISNTLSNLAGKMTLKSDTAENKPELPSEEDLQKLREQYEKAEQEQVFKFYDELEPDEKATLYHQIKDLPDPAYVNELAKKVLSPPKEEDDEEKNKKPALEPLPSSATSSVLDSKPEDLDNWYEKGLDLIGLNKVAVVLMAGGQGTRLGSAAPKGCYNIGLPSEKSLFQLQAERILKVQKLAAKKKVGDGEVIVPWYVMTSGPTRLPTEAFFREHKFFGLQEKDVFIFEQGVLPCISNEGKILLESKSKVAVAPDGNGGIYQALILSGAVQDMQKRGIQHIHAYCVDNCLVKVADPTFIGFAASKEVDIATKVVRKRDAKEPVGLIVQKNGKPDVVEYSEIDTETAEAKESSHEDALLKFRAANIVNHYYSFGFLESIPSWSKDLPHHVAKKKIPCIDTETGKSVKPEKPNGIKLEQFVFDCFPFLPMDKFACMEVKREDEFSPLKNGKDSKEDNPNTSKEHIMAQGRRWLEAAGMVVEDEGDGAGIEVSPLVSYDGEGLDFMKGKSIKAPAVIER